MDDVTEMGKCPVCGASIPLDAKVCPECGEVFNPNNLRKRHKYEESLPLLKKQVFLLLVFSLLSSITAIIHGVFMDMDFQQIKRLTLEGLILTFLVLFPGTLILEWIFDINNEERLDELERKIEELEK